MIAEYAKMIDRAVLDSMRKASVFNTPKLTLGGAGDNRIGHMRGALKATSSKHLPSYNQMSYGRKLSFISRVERHGKKQYSNQQHMRDIYAHYIAARVAHELKE